MESSRTCWGLLRRRQCLALTLRGWLLLVLSVAALGLFAACAAYPFLAVTRSVPGGILVVEGWSSDNVLKFALAEYKQNSYTQVLVSGFPVEQGTLLTDYTNYAHVGAATLVKLGLSSNDVQVAPCCQIKRDRTYNMALAAKHFLHGRDPSPVRVNLITVGPHARRSWLLYEKAFGRSARVGVIAAPPLEYDACSWWKCSAGVRNVIGELIAYAYARFLFHPHDE